MPRENLLVLTAIAPAPAPADMPGKQVVLVHGGDRLMQVNAWWRYA